MSDKARSRTFFNGRGVRLLRSHVSVQRAPHRSKAPRPWTLALLEFRTLSTRKRASGNATGGWSHRIATALLIGSGDHFGISASGLPLGWQLTRWRAFPSQGNRVALDSGGRRKAVDVVAGDDPHRTTAQRARCLRRRS